jgi:DNA modification methylase
VGTRTSSFGAGKREGHDSSAFYARGLATPEWSADRTLGEVPARSVNRVYQHSSEDMSELPDNSVALMVTSPPYHVGKDYDSDATFDEFLGLLERVLAETYRVLEPGGRAVVNVANLGRRPYIPLSSIITEMAMRLGYFCRGEVIWVKAVGAGGNCAWGSWRSASNPTLRDLHEYCLCFSKGRMERVRRGRSTIERDEFMEATLSVWHLPSESARRVGHPAPFPVALPRRFIELYTFEGDVVLDPFLGSGSTAVAAVEAGRRWIGYDTDPSYARLAKRRVDEARAAAAVAAEERLGAAVDQAAGDEATAGAGLDRAGLDRAGLDRAGLDQAGADQAGADQAAVEAAARATPARRARASTLRTSPSARPAASQIPPS